ncbi:unnamed protein product [Microthlaspi erraticum]|uniref:Uncharacterized protein n=1 Tax=Microthlaspi erraticum TaxID=1685480 RepID=A0A6D2KLX2_9BRAS|nr:unnamed protein product [Microthlaspi erraticum]
MFMKSWAHICRLQEDNKAKEFPLLPEDLTPCLDRTVINLPSGFEQEMMELLFYLSKNIDNLRNLRPPPNSEISPDVVHATFELTAENIEKLRERVNTHSSRSLLQLHLSTFVIAYAYAWTCLVKSRGGNPNRLVIFLYAADFRYRLDPKVPATYFGNCVFPIGWFEYEARTFSEEDGFVNAVEILSDSVKGLGSRRIESLWKDYLEGSSKIKSATQFGSVAGSTRLGVYGLDFGWGRPAKTEVLSIDRSEGFSMSERRDEPGGVEMGLCLKKIMTDPVVGPGSTMNRTYDWIGFPVWFKNN